MTEDDAIARLIDIQKNSNDDPEIAHSEADKVLCELITALGFKDVVEEWAKIKKWYA